MACCAAYLRVYEPLSAFPAAEARSWAAYARSAARPRRAAALAAEASDALRRVLATPPVAAPAVESGHAYVRWAGGVTYICPWQTRLRCWLALARLEESVPLLASAAFPAGAVRRVSREFARWPGGGPSARVYIHASPWSVPWEWFAVFAREERWLVLGAPGETGDTGDGVRATASATRTLVYATTMDQARRRAARALDAVRRACGQPAAGSLTGPSAPARVLAGLGDVGCWLEEFHPHSLVELDYGGLVDLLTDEALRADQSVAEVSTAISALAAGELELATAMERRLSARWQAMEAYSQAS